jgi:hypothetical protein
MTPVDLNTIGYKDKDAWPAIKWLLQTHGPAGGKWKLNGVNRVEFANEKEALLFILRWSS